MADLLIVSVSLNTTHWFFSLTSKKTGVREYMRIIFFSSHIIGYSRKIMQCNLYGEDLMKEFNCVNERKYNESFGSCRIILQYRSSISLNNT